MGKVLIEENNDKSIVNITFLVCLSVGLFLLVIALVLIYVKCKKRITEFFRPINMEGSIDIPISSVLPMN